MWNRLVARHWGWPLLTNQYLYILSAFFPLFTRNGKRIHIYQRQPPPNNHGNKPMSGFCQMPVWLQKDNFSVNGYGCRRWKYSRWCCFTRNNKNSICRIITNGWNSWLSTWSDLNVMLKKMHDQSAYGVNLKLTYVILLSFVFIIRQSSTQRR